MPCLSPCGASAPAALNTLELDRIVTMTTRDERLILFQLRLMAPASSLFSLPEWSFLPLLSRGAASPCCFVWVA